MYIVYYVLIIFSALAYRNHFFDIPKTIKILNPFPHLSMHQLSQCLRGTPTIIHRPRFITHNSGSRVRIFSRRYLGTYGCGIKKPERRWKGSFHRVSRDGPSGRSLLPHIHPRRTLSFNSSTSPPADKHSGSVLQSHRA